VKYTIERAFLANQKRGYENWIGVILRVLPKKPALWHLHNAGIQI